MTKQKEITLKPFGTKINFSILYIYVLKTKLQYIF